MTDSWKARKMVPGKDTVSTMAMHYGLKPTQVRDVIKQTGVEVIRADGFKGTLAMVAGPVNGSGRKIKVVGWSDGQPGFDPNTVKLTGLAIKAVSRWTFQRDEVKTSDI